MIPHLSFVLCLFLLGVCAYDHVLLIGIDGLNPSCLHNATSNTGFSTLAALGASTLEARTTIQTFSAPGWSSTLCSMRPDFTGITSNDWVSPNDTATKPTYTKDGGFEPASFPIKPAVYPFPCMTSLLSSFTEPNITTYGYYDWLWLDHVTQGLDRRCSLPQANASADALLVKTYLNDYPSMAHPSFAFLYFGNVDDVGHASTWCSPAYEEAVGQVDRHLQTILETVDLSTTLIALTADHGGVIGTKHHSWGGQDSLLIPWFMAGSTIQPGSSPALTTRNLDMGPTLFYAMGLEPHPEWVGRIHKDIFI